MEPVHEQELGYEEQQVRHGEARKEDVEDQLFEGELVAREGKSGQRGEYDRYDDGREGDEEAVEKVVAETVLRPRLHVVLHRRMGGDENGRPEETSVGLERQREHVQEGTEREQRQEQRDSQT